MKVTCSKCQGEAPLQTMLTQRTVPAHPTVTEVGLECPTCHYWQHSYFEDRRLRREQAKLADVRLSLQDNGNRRNRRRYDTLKRRYAERSARFNAYWRTKTGTPAPADLVQQEAADV